MFKPFAYLWREHPYGPDLDGVLVNASLAIMSIRQALPPGWARSAPPPRSSRWPAAGLVSHLQKSTL
ncbi:hypothetical protein [Nonomuraea sp. NPDC049129]|uniref:hypothetical protein n=1 Tax=Nonomuraea sp. NPDC049129 TaxID=3155272 RepID=UPI0033E7C7EF